jgi:hypothetical protein
MRFTQKGLFVGCFVLFVVTFIGAIAAFLIWSHYSSQEWQRKHDEYLRESRKKRKAETVGTITNFKSTPSTGSSMSYTHTVYYEFVVDGKSYSRSNSVGQIGIYGKHRNGVQGKVCYEPSNPENAYFSLKEENRVCGQ